MVAAGCTRWIAVLVALILPVVAAGQDVPLTFRGEQAPAGAMWLDSLEPLTPARPFPPTAGSNSLSGTRPTVPAIPKLPTRLD